MFIYFMVIEIYFIRLLINRNKSICIYMGFYNLILAYIYIILNYNYLSKHLIVYFFGFKMSLFLGFTLFFMTFFFLGFLLSSYINILQRIYMAYIFKHLFFLLNNIILKKKVLVNTILFRIESSDIKYTTEEIKIIVHSAFDKFENPGFWETWKWWLLGGTLLLIIGGIIVYMYTGDPKDISSVSSGSSGSSGGSTSSYTPKGLDLANTPLPEIGTLSNVDNTSIIGTLGSQVDLTGVAATGGATLLASKFFFKGRKFISEGLVYGKGAQGYINETQVLVSKLSDEDILLSVTNALEKLETHKLYNDFILSMVRIQPKFVGQS